MIAMIILKKKVFLRKLTQMASHLKMGKKANSSLKLQHSKRRE